MSRQLAVLRLAGMAAGGTLVYAGLCKMGKSAELLAVVEPHHLVGADTAVLVATWLPLLEVVLGTAAVLGFQLASWGVVLLYSGLTAVVARALALGLQIPCGCFSGIEPLSSADLLRDAGLLGLAIAGALAGMLHSRGGSS